MEGVRFHSVNNNEKEFAREVKKRVRAYFKQNNLSTQGNRSLHLKTVVMLALYLIPFIAVLTVAMPAWTALVMTVLMGIGEAGIGMSVMHDGAHGSYSSKAWANKLAAATMFLLGSNTFNWKIQHNVKHHTYTNIFNYDADISTKAVIRLCEHAPLRKYHRYQQLYAFPLYGLMTFLRLFGDISMLIEYNRNGVTQKQGASPSLELIKLVSTKVIYMTLLIGMPLWLTDFSIWQIIIGFTIMHIVAGMIMSTVFQMAHVVEGTYQPLPDENNVIHSEWLVHQLRSTSDFGRKNGLLSWFIGGLDFQIEHHLYPNICHVHYPAIAPIVEATAKEYGFAYNLNRTFLHALVSHYHRLKALGRNSVVS